MSSQSWPGMTCKCGEKFVSGRCPACTQTLPDTIFELDTTIDRVAQLVREKSAAYVHLYTLVEELVKSVPKDLEWQAEGFVNVRIRQLARLKAAL